MTRSYRLKQRAQRQDQTRQRIVDATIELHQANGIAATSISDIAERAKVAKVTVYRHFPDQEALVSACSGQYFERHPMPDPDNWRYLKDPHDRFRHGLQEIYAYHRETELMIAQVLPEARDLPIMEPYHAYWRNVVDVLAAPFEGRTKPEELLRAALALAVSFETWYLLVHSHELEDVQIIKLMMRMVQARCDASLNNSETI